jgi:protein SCO1/2
MSKNQKIVTVALWTILVMVMLGVIGAGVSDWLKSSRAQAGPPLEVKFDAPSFSLIDQNDQVITDQSLRGHPYIASFVFTQCAGPCPLITGKMAHLQSTIADPSVKFLSFSVDPEHDTPAVLKEYAGRFNADAQRWHFLTGKPDDVYAAIRGMNIALQAAQEQTPLLHSTKILLVDKAGHVRGIYDTGEHAAPDTLNRLARDAHRLAGENAK